MEDELGILVNNLSLNLFMENFKLKIVFPRMTHIYKTPIQNQFFIQNHLCRIHSKG